MLGDVVHRLTGQAQIEAAGKATDEGREHVSDAVTLYEVQQAVVLAAYGSFAFGPAPTSPAFNEVLAGIPGGATLFFVACLMLGAGQLVALAVTRLLGWHPHHDVRRGILLVSAFLLLMIAAAWFNAGGYAASVISLVPASASMAAWYAVTHRNGG